MGQNYWNQKGHSGKPGFRQWLQTQAPAVEEAVYKSTFNLQTHIDVREVAVLDAFLRKLGHNPRSLSELGKMTIQLVVNAAIQDDFSPPETAQEALDYLTDLGYAMGQFQSRGRQQRRIVTALQRESLLEQSPQKEQEHECQAPMVEDPYAIWRADRIDQLRKEQPSRDISDILSQAQTESDALESSQQMEDHLTVHSHYFRTKGWSQTGALDKAKNALRGRTFTPASSLLSEQEQIELNKKAKAREEEFAAQKKAQEEFLASLRVQQEE